MKSNNNILEDFHDRFSSHIKYYFLRRPVCAFTAEVKSDILVSRCMAAEKDRIIRMEFTMKCRAGECKLVEAFSETEAKLWLEGKTPDLVKTIAERLLDDANELILVPQ